MQKPGGRCAPVVVPGERVDFWNLILENERGHLGIKVNEKTHLKMATEAKPLFSKGVY